MKTTVLILLLASGFTFSVASAQNITSQNDSAAIEHMRDLTEKANAAKNDSIQKAMSGKDKELFDKICGVWSIKNIEEGSNLSNKIKKESKKMIDEMLKDSYFYFKPDGMLQIHVATSDVDGSWQITGDGKMLVMYNNSNIPERFSIQKISKTDISLSLSGREKLKISLVREGNALTNEQQEQHAKKSALHLKEENERYKQAYKDSVAAMNAMVKDSMETAKEYARILEQQHQDSISRIEVDFTPCYYLDLICAPFTNDAVNLKKNVVSKDENYEYYRSFVLLPDAVRCSYGFEKSADKPRKFEAVFGENLTEKDALELYKKELAVYKQCKTESWHESMHRENNGRWSYTELSGGAYGYSKELSVEMNINESNRTYSVELKVEEE